MGTITIRSPEWSRQWLGAPVNAYGVRRLSYMGGGCWTVEMAQKRSVDPQAVKAILSDMQRVVPLGGIGDYDVLCLDLHILASDDPAWGYAEGVATSGFVALSGQLADAQRHDIITHEITHRLAERFIDSLEEAQLFALIGQVRGSNDSIEWGDRPQERLAEYVSAALWGAPIRSDLPQLDTATLAKVRSWAMEQFAGHAPANIVVDGEEHVVTLRKGDHTMYVNGEPVVLDVAPIHVDPPGRIVVPVRAIVESLTALLDVVVEWDEPTKTVTMRFKRK